MVISTPLIDISFQPIGTHLPCLEVFKLVEITANTPIQCAPGAVPASPPFAEFLHRPPPWRGHASCQSLCELGRIVPGWEMSFNLYPRYVEMPYLTQEEDFGCALMGGHANGGNHAL